MPFEKPTRLVDLMDADFTDESQRNRFVQAPVERFLLLRVGRDCPPTRFFVPLGAGHDRFAQVAIADKRQQEMSLRIRATFPAAVYPLWQPGQIDHGPRPVAQKNELAGSLAQPGAGESAQLALGQSDFAGTHR